MCVLWTWGCSLTQRGMRTPAPGAVRGYPGHPSHRACQHTQPWAVPPTVGRRLPCAARLGVVPGTHTEPEPRQDRIPELRTGISRARLGATPEGTAASLGARGCLVSLSLPLLVLLQPEEAPHREARPAGQTQAVPPPRAHSPGMMPLMSLSGLVWLFWVRCRISFLAASNCWVAMSHRRDSGKTLRAEGPRGSSDLWAAEATPPTPPRTIRVPEVWTWWQRGAMPDQRGPSRMTAGVYRARERWGLWGQSAPGHHQPGGHVVAVAVSAPRLRLPLSLSGEAMLSHSGLPARNTELCCWGHMVLCSAGDGA